MSACGALPRSTRLLGFGPNNAQFSVPLLSGAQQMRGGGGKGGGSLFNLENSPVFLWLHPFNNSFFHSINYVGVFVYNNYCIGICLNG